MAGTCYLVYSGGTINLQDHTGGMDFTYTPTAPNMSDEFAQDTARLRIANASITNIRNALGSVSRALDEARIYSGYGGGTAPVYLYLQPAGYPDAWRSEIIQGNITPADYVLNAPIWETTGTKVIEFNMEFTRRNYFEGTLTPLTLSNPNGTSGTVYWDNYNDGGGIAGRKRYNYVDIAGTAVAGDLVAPIKLTVTDVNASGGADFKGFRNLNIHVGWSGSYTAITRLEAEAGTLTGTPFSNSGASNGTFMGTAYYQQNPLTDYDKYQGNFYEIYSRVTFGTYVSETSYAQIVNDDGTGGPPIMDSTSVNQKFTKKVADNAYQWNDLGQLRFPPIYIGGTVNANAGLKIQVFYTPTNFDVVHILPMDKRMVGTINTAIHQMVFDTISGIHYSYGGNGPSWALPTIQPLQVYGDLGLMPGKDQRIHFLDTYAANPLGTAFYTVSVSYRPRRLTI